MANSKQIVYLSQAQYAELIANGSITVDGVTVTYDQNDIYVTPQAEPVTDVRVAGTSIGSNGVANIPYATTNSPGIVKLSSAYGTGSENNNLLIVMATNGQIKEGYGHYQPIVPTNQHQSVFYGLSKVAGANLANESNITVGTYPDSSKAAIQNMLGITDLISTEESSTATAAHALNSTFMMDGKLHRATAAIAIGDAVEVGTNCEVVKADEVFVKKTDYARENEPGIVGLNSNYGITINNQQPGHYLYLNPATPEQIKAGTQPYRAITPDRQEKATFYGLSKVAGVDLANETVTLGQYPNTSKVAIRKMIDALGVNNISTGFSVDMDAETGNWILSANVQDVQVNGASVVSNGVANIPITSTTSFGVVQLDTSYGIGLHTDNKLLLIEPTDSDIKQALSSRRLAITTRNHHKAVFYGLAKAAGDTTMASSSNAIGTYTTEAKAAIHTMLGIDPASIAAQVDIPLIETVSGTTPTITGQPNVRYVCGEVSTITITPPASGSVDVIFESGSTATTMTVPSTVKWPAWFNAEALEANTTYEVLITDGIYGSVMTWVT